MADEDKYQYDAALPIRFLEVYPNTGGPLHGRILNFKSLDSPGIPEYEALSYVWGQPVFNHSLSLHLDGGEEKCFWISENLSDALRRVIYADNPRLLWVDAVCIDQSNIPERNSTVALMQDIYQQAKSVLIYLGQDGSSRDEIFLLGMTAIHTAFSKTRDLSKVDSVVEDLARKTRGIGIDSEAEEVWRAFRGFLQEKKWLRRMWTIQEAAMARDSTVFSTRWLMTGRSFFDVMNALHNSNLPTSFSGITDGFESNVATALRRINFVYTLRGLISRNERGSLMRYLQTCRGNEATDKHDVIYALIGLCQKEDRDRMPAIDYSEPWHTTYTRFAWYLLESGTGSDIFLDCIDYLVEPGLPTWVPNWAAAENDSTIRPSSSRLAYYNYSSALTTMYFAAGKTKLEFEAVSDEGEHENKEAVPKAIRLKGSVLGSLKTIGTTYLEPAYYSPTLFAEMTSAIGQAIIEIHTFLSAHAENYKYDGLNGSEDAFDVLTCYQHWQENRILVQEDKAIYRAFVRKHALELDTPFPSGPKQGQASRQKEEAIETPSAILNKMLSSTPTPIPTPPPPPPPISPRRSLTRPRTWFQGSSPSTKPPITTTRPPTAADISAYIHKAAAFTFKKKRCVTHTGILCQTPRTARAGDRVVVLWGVRIPLLLRPLGGKQEEGAGEGEGERYGVVGECFAHGMMASDVLETASARERGVWITLV